jgi:hypothetical protein
MYREKEGVHICHWETIVHPKLYGRFGLKNMDMFGWALGDKILRRCMKKNGLFNKVVKDKYLHNYFVNAWFRGTFMKSCRVLNSWRCLLDSFHIISDCFSLKRGAGTLIRTREDSLIGLFTCSTLIENLISILWDKGFNYIF